MSDPTPAYSVSEQGMVDEVMNADEVIIIAVTNHQMKVITSDPDAHRAIGNIAAAQSMMVGTLADAMFAEPAPTQLDG